MLFLFEIGIDLLPIAFNESFISIYWEWFRFETTKVALK